MKNLIVMLLLGKVRNFQLSKIALFVYIILLWTISLLYIKQEMSGSVYSLQLSNNSQILLYVLTISIILELIVKIQFFYNLSFMNDLIQTKPICNIQWNLFVFISMMINAWNFIVPVLFFILNFILINVVNKEILICAYLMSMVNTYTVSGIKGLPIKKKIIIMMNYILFIIGNFWIATKAENTTLPSIIINMYFLSVLAIFIPKSKVYTDELFNCRKSKTIVLKINFLTEELIAILRSRRLFCSIIIPSVLVLLYPIYSIAKNESDLFEFIFLSISIPPILYGQWLFGIEANYFNGIWTKPILIQDMLERKYVFCVALNLIVFSAITFTAILYGAATLNLLLCVIVSLLYSSGVVNLLILPICLFSSKIDLNGSPILNSQGSNVPSFLYAILCIMPILFVPIVLETMKPFVCYSMMLGLSAWAIIFHRKTVDIITRIYLKQRYKAMERYMA